MRRSLPSCRAALAGVAAVVLLTACGGGGDDADSAASASSSTSSASSTSAAPTSQSQSPEVAAFCAQVLPLLGQLEAAASGQNGEQTPALLQQVLTAYEQVEPPAEIASDWQALGGPLRQLSDTAATIDFSTPAGQQQFLQTGRQLLAQVGTAQSTVVSYVTANCLGGRGSTSSSSAPSS